MGAHQEESQVSQTQSIIVYRNPMEQQLWEGGYVPLFLGAGVLFIVFTLILLQIAGMVFGKWNVERRTWPSVVCMALAALATVFVFHLLPF